jgi:hypothetical protein
MAKNKIKFQRGMSVPDFMNQYGTSASMATGNSPLLSWKSKYRACSF